MSKQAGAADTAGSNKARRILMLTHSVYLRDVRVRRYAERLADQGFIVHVICYALEDRGAQSDRPEIVVHALPGARKRREGARLILNWIYTALMMFLYTTRLSILHRIDLVHVHNMPDFLVFSALIPWIRQRPVILNIHDPMPEIARSKLGLDEKHPMIRGLILCERICAGLSTRVIAASPAFKSLLVERGTDPAKISVIMNAADSRIFPPGKSPVARDAPDPFTLLYVGTVARRYGLWVLVKALPLIAAKVPGVRVVVHPKIKNEGEPLDECVDLAHELGVGDRFLVKPPARLEQMPSIMAKADLGVYPAIADCHMDIALSLKIPEMASVGLPIVATRLGVLEELYGQDSIAFTPSGDHEALAARVVELYGAPEKRRAMAQKGLELSERFTWDSQYAIYRELLDELLA